MSAKYRQRLLQSSGVSNTKFSSQYAKKLMLSMGWKQGNGLGKNQHGSKQCIQVRRRQQNLGLGVRNQKDSFNWKDQWWNDAYNNSIKKLNILPSKLQSKKNKVQQSSSDSSDNSDSSDQSSSQQSGEVHRPKLGAVQKHKIIHKKQQHKKQQYKKQTSKKQKHSKTD